MFFNGTINLGRYASLKKKKKKKFLHKDSKA